jgi:sigma-B regulation protein RsbU (phosphoserine phosphatase)
MPDKNPKVSGWKLWLYTRPANDVGGDLVDIVKMNLEKYGVLIADVSGKGLGAALLMAKLQTLIRAFAPDFAVGSTLVQKLNKVFYKDVLSSSFASLAYFIISENSNSVEIVNAGHLPPIHLSGNNIHSLKKGGAALGLLPESKYDSEYINLEKGEILITVSDGVTEARNIHGQFFGNDLLVQTIKSSLELAPDELGARIVSRVDYFIGEAKRHDDLSIIILQYTG